MFSRLNMIPQPIIETINADILIPTSAITGPKRAIVRAWFRKGDAG
jgi:hypothetical protein